ncbi:hypothetical protein N7495_009495 [Penicillium taxi]|uniref:uncharacterized protein n=1 Tax=Penicillium taxi TaxID=168475 RepID=UPI002545AD1A|nr:uncharacterized protein N7495_009495 [Penicillium taxi]KAJ5884985.1 hypothetical protein N7495_009495 [Penicillium taxi]
MSEINVIAVIYPKPEHFQEVATLLTGFIRKVQDQEPDTLLYYAFHVEANKEIVVVERYKNQTAVQTHLKTPYFQEFAAQLSGWLAKPSEVRVGGVLSGPLVSRL